MCYAIKVHVSYQALFSMICPWFIVFNGKMCSVEKFPILSILQMDVQLDIKIAKAFTLCKHSKQALASY